MSGARGLSARMRDTLGADARQWIGGDVAVTIKEPPSEEEAARMESLRRAGVQLTVVTETYAMAASETAADPVVVYVKSVDTASYPLYGKIGLEPGESLAEALREDTVAATPELLNRLHVHPGDTIRINRAKFRVAATITAEPDRFAGFPAPFPRLILSNRAFERTGIALQGSTETFHLRFRSSPGVPSNQLREQLEQIFPYGDIAGYQDPDPRAVESLDATCTFLNLTGWLSLALGALGIATTAYLHIEERLDTVASLKALGATAPRVLSIHVLQIIALSGAGAGTGALLGLVVEAVLLRFVASQLALPATSVPDWRIMAESIALGLVSALALAMGPLWRAVETPPWLILRRWVEPRRRLSRNAAVSGAMVLTGTLLWVTQSIRISAWLFAGLLILGAAVSAAMPMIRWAIQILRACRRLPMAVRYGLLNLVRAESRSYSMLFVLLLGTLLLSAAWVGQEGVGEEIALALPAPGATHYVLAVKESELAPVKRFLEENPSVVKPVLASPFAWLRLLTPKGGRMRFVSCLDTPPAAGRMIEGGWWLDRQPPEAVISQELAREAGVRTGGFLRFQLPSGTLTARVSGIRELDRVDNAAHAITLPCKAMKDMRVFYHIAFTAAPGRRQEVERKLAARFPLAPVVSREVFASMVREVSRRALSMLRILAGLVLAGGFILLAMLIASTRDLRRREAAIWKALGARRGALWLALFTELGMTGLAAGLLGGLLGNALACVLLTIAIGRPAWRFDLPVLAACSLLDAVLACCAGFAASRRTFSRRVMDVLREP
ncbi:MAG: FtsX-like permease family protein [Bryobacterales bacterium]|nr:FtsX-like permease family protein [Bryobacterales bacterium]